MEFTHDAIKEISERQIAYFGGPGMMLLPSRATVEALLHKIPPRQLLTTDLLRKTLAAQFKVQGTCPVTTKKVLQLIAHDPATAAPYWRVIKQNGELNTIFPGGTAAQAARLKQEGFTVDDSGKKPKSNTSRTTSFNSDSSKKTETLIM